MRQLIIAASVITAPLLAHAGDYDFSYSNLNHLKGAYQMCEKMGFSGNGPDCPVVYDRCWSPQYTYHSGGKLKTKCKKASSFSGTEQDGNKAISDGNGMLKTPS